ncbi:MAG: hypothetical protein SGI90_05485, partial [Candidatus Eisenbacteria bacterium]|nr:hypothetical protein [Candidatus Eisenbacteria bacterium]
MKLQVAARAGHDDPEGISASVQNIAGVQQIAQTLVSQHAAEEQEGSRLEARNISVDIRPAEYAMGNDVNPSGHPGIQVFEFRLHARPMHDQPVCPAAEPGNDSPLPAM